MIRIDIEGGDGSGKTTFMNHFVELLRKQQKRVLETREVGNLHIPGCVELRKTVLSNHYAFDPKAMELIFSAMRIENERFYETKKNDFDFIVSDRGWLSHLAYCDANCGPDFTSQLYTDCISKHTPIPDVVIFLYVDEQVARTRRELRGGPVDAIEAKGSEFQEKVQMAFKRHLSNLPNVFYVDANQSLDKILEQANNIVEELINYA